MAEKIEIEFTLTLPEFIMLRQWSVEQAIDCLCVDIPVSAPEVASAAQVLLDYVLGQERPDKVVSLRPVPPDVAA